MINKVTLSLKKGAKVQNCKMKKKIRRTLTPWSTNLFNVRHCLERFIQLELGFHRLPGLRLTIKTQDLRKQPFFGSSSYTYLSDF